MSAHRRLTAAVVCTITEWAVSSTRWEFSGGHEAGAVVTGGEVDVDFVGRQFSALRIKPVVGSAAGCTGLLVDMRDVVGVREQVGQPHGDGRAVVVHGHLRRAGGGSVVRRGRLHGHERRFHEIGPLDGIGRRGIDIARVNVGLVRVVRVPCMVVVVVLVCVEYGLLRTSGQQGRQSGGKNRKAYPLVAVMSSHWDPPVLRFRASRSASASAFPGGACSDNRVSALQTQGSAVAPDLDVGTPDPPSAHWVHNGPLQQTNLLL